MIHYYVKKQLFKLFKSNEKKEKYIIALDSPTMMREEEQADRLINMSTLHPTEYKMAVAFMCELARKAMKSGRAFQLGDLGYLYPKIRAKSVDKKEDATAEKTLEKFSYYFRPSKSLAKQFKNEHYRKVWVPNDPLREEETD